MYGIFVLFEISRIPCGHVTGEGCVLWRVDIWMMCCAARHGKNALNVWSEGGGDKQFFDHVIYSFRFHEHNFRFLLDVELINEAIRNKFK